MPTLCNKQNYSEMDAKLYTKAKTLEFLEKKKKKKTRDNLQDLELGKCFFHRTQNTVTIK